MGGEGNVLRITSLELKFWALYSLKAGTFVQIQSNINLIRCFDVYQVSLNIIAICAVF